MNFEPIFNLQPISFEDIRISSDETSCDTEVITDDTEGTEICSEEMDCEDESILKFWCKNSRSWTYLL